jgi:hypothetical protein
MLAACGLRNRVHEHLRSAIGSLVLIDMFRPNGVSELYAALTNGLSAFLMQRTLHGTY